jgi:hypothetical protein
VFVITLVPIPILPDDGLKTNFSDETNIVDMLPLNAVEKPIYLNSFD